MRRLARFISRLSSLSYDNLLRWPRGRLTFRMLYAQIRASLALPRAASVRLCAWRPWYRFSNDVGGIPERALLPASDEDARSLIGTTLCYYPYTRLRDEEDTQNNQPTTPSDHDTEGMEEVDLVEVLLDAISSTPAR